MASLNDIQEIVETALKLPGSAREDFLERACAGNREVREEVEALLGMAADGKFFPDEPLLPENPVDLTGRVLGVYRLESRLGVGGMGTVYLGRRIDREVEMTTAIKVLHKRLGNEMLAKQFKQERQVLADFRHPHIAALYDAGTTEEGYPYFIMEHIEGQTIDQWYLGRRPGLDRLLRVFQDILKALEKAHERKIIHCDIKPGNLMVTHDGVVKLLDFGIASLSNQAGEKGAATGFLTPHYASPEQLQGGQPGPASDIYSLGVVLLHLLSGLAPGRWPAAPQNMIRGLMAGRFTSLLNEPVDESEPAMTGTLPAILPEALGHVLRKVLASDPEQRCPDAATLQRALARILVMLPQKDQPQPKDKAFDAYLWCHPEGAGQAAWIRQQLASQGLKLFPGMAQPEDMDAFGKAIEQCRVFILCVGPGTLAGWHAHPEAGEVLAYRADEVRLMPLLLPGADFPSKQSALPSYLRNLAWFTFGKDQQDQDSIRLAHEVLGEATFPAADDGAVSACPYPGLEAFREEDSRFFFGREAVSQRILACLEEQPFIAVLGPSGSGKSSIVRAGVVPTLRRRKWAVAILMPGKNPLESLAHALSGLLDPAHPGIRDRLLVKRLARDADALYFVAQELIEHGGYEQLCLVIDQFEESFTLCNQPDLTAQFLANLERASGQDRHAVRLVVTMRSDFLGHCANYPGFNCLLVEHAIQVTEMQRADLVRAIRTPAQMVGVNLEPGLLEQMLEDVRDEPGMLPLVGHALLELFRYRESKQLTMAKYAAIGGIEGALARRAEQEYQRLDERAQSMLRQMFTLCLIQPGMGTEDTRRPASREELLQMGWDRLRADQLLECLTEARLLTAFQDGFRGVQMVELAHEALIRKWPRIGLWMEEDRERAWQLGTLRNRAQAWAQSGFEADQLPRGSQLETMKALMAETSLPLASVERDFVMAGLDLEARRVAEAERAARRLMRRKNQALAASLVALMLAGTAMFFYVRAKRDHRQAVSARNLALSREKEANLSLASLLEGKTGDALDDGQVGQAWIYALSALSMELPAQQGEPGILGHFSDPRMQQARILEWSSPSAFLAGQVALSPDGKWAAFGCSDDAIRIIDMRSGAPAAVLTGHAGTITTLIFHPDGERLFSASEDRQLRLWLYQDGRWHAPEGESAFFHQAEVRTLALSHDGHTLVSGDGRGMIRIWRAAGLTDPQVLATDQGSFRRMVFAADGSTLVFATGTGSLMAMSLPSASPRTIARGVVINDLVVDGGHVIAACQDGDVRIWPLDAHGPAGMEAVVRFPGQGRAAVALAKIPEKPQVCVLDDQGGLRILEFPGGKLVHTWPGFSHEVAAGSGSLALGAGILVAAMEGQVPVFWHADGSRLAAAVPGHRDQVEDVAFSPDGRLVASGSRDRSVRVWNPETGSATAVFSGHREGVEAIDFHPDGSLLASCDREGVVLVWDLAQKDLVRRLQATGQPAYCLSFSPRGHLLATGAGPTIIIWDSISWEELFRLEGHSQRVNRLLFTPDGRFLISISNDNSLKLWDMKTHSLATNLHNLPFLPIGLAVDPSGEWVAVGGWDFRIRWWPLAQLAATRGNLELAPAVELSDHQGPVSAMAFSPGGDLLVTASQEEEIILWDVPSKKLIRSFRGHKDDIFNLAFSPDGLRVATASYDRTVKIWDIQAPQPIGRVAAPGEMVSSMTFSPDGQWLVTTSRDEFLSLWDMKQRRVTETLHRAGVRFRDASFSPDGDWLAVTTMKGFLGLYHLPQKTWAAFERVHQGNVFALCFFPDGKRVATCSQDRTIKIFEVPSLHCQTTLPTQQAIVRDLALTPDGKVLASACFDLITRLWDVSAGTELASLAGHTDLVLAVTFSVDGQWLVSVGRDGTARLWSMAAQEWTRVLKHNESLYAVCFLENDQFLALAGISGTVYLWDTRSWQEVARVSDESRPINLLATDPAHHLLVSMGKENSLRFWEMAHLQFFEREAPNMADCRRMLERALFYYEFRMEEGTRLRHEPRFYLVPLQDHVFPETSPYKDLVEIRPRQQELLPWLLGR